MFDNIILIPYRNREAHLDYFIKNTVPLFKEHLPNSKVVIIEQTEGKLFNRGMLLNVGFKEYENKTKYFFTHDVDMNPSLEIIKSIYTKEDIEMFRVKLIHNLCLGGIIKFKHDVIFDINGFPNNIWGWGIEDRALYYRCCMKNVRITNNPYQSFKIMPHKSNAVQYAGEKKQISDMWCKNYINKLDDIQKEEMIMGSGLNNLEYKIVTKKSINDMVEVIKVEI
jgi:beta-1,4-galactosyltransferase 1